MNIFFYLWETGQIAMFYPSQNKRESTMKHTYTTLDYEALTCLTGDPFVDAGGFVLEELSKRNPDSDIMDLIMLATQIYVDCWDAKINTFFLNSKITQPAFNTADKKKKETERYFKELLDDTAPHVEGYCRVTGRKTNLYPAGRDNSVLSGSSTFVNFHHSFESGLMLSKEVLIRCHFLPLACEQMQGKIGVISSSNPATAAFYAKKCCSRTLYDKASNMSKGVLKNESRSPGTALFRFLDHLLSELNPTKDEQLTLYHFTNFGASPEAQVYTLPFPAFQFYRETKRPVYTDCWKKFIAAHYHKPREFKNAAYQIDQHVFLATEKKETRTLKEDEFQYWSNSIYNKLMRSQSIVKEIRKWSVKQLFDFRLLKCYLINIRHMKNETIEKIQQIADFILGHYKETDMKKVLTTLNAVKSPYMLRRFILRMVAENYQQDGDILVSVNDYVNYLFPDTSSWMETRDVLLIAIYQKLHEKHVKVEVDVDELDDEDFVDDID